jgi:amidase
MKQRRRITAKWLPAGILLLICLDGCQILPRTPAAHSHDRAFIHYWRPPKGNKQLRLAVKDNIDMAGVVTTAGSQYVAKNSPPASKDAPCLAIARQRDVRIVGKTNLSEFAVSPSGLNEYYGTPRNRLSKHLKLIPGGSSSGSAVAIRDGMADVAFGTDTAGSVRVPAACCGIVGLKTTFGLVSLKGVFPIEPWHLDTVGPMGKDIAYVVQGMDLLQNGFEARYRGAVAAKPSARDIKIGRLYLSGTDPEIDRAVDKALVQAGFHVIKLGQAFKARWDRAKTDGNTVAAAGAWLSDQKYAFKLGVSSRTLAAIILGRVLYPASYQAALHRRAAWRHALRQVFRKVDFIALPTLQALPPQIPRVELIALMEARMLILQNTVAVNLAGNPALAVPVPVDDKNVPLTSLQLVGPPLSEAELLNAGRLIEDSTSPVHQPAMPAKQ